MTKESYLHRRARSFKHAFRGVGIVLAEPHARIHLAATGVVLGASVWLGLSLSEWLWIVGAIVAVWAAESFNTAVEALADAAVPEEHPLIRNAKDTAAAGVLIAAIGAAVIGVLVLGPRLLGRIT